jgi:hypothetical protein
MYLKRIVFICFLLFAIKSISAQPDKFQFGVKGGLNLSAAAVNNAEAVKLKTGYHLGATVGYLFFPNFELQSGLFLSAKGSIIDGLDINSYVCGKPDITHTFNELYLNVPVYAVFRKNVSDNFIFNIGFGPYFGYGIGGETVQTFHGSNEERKWDTFGKGEIYSFGKFDFGPAIIADIEYNKFIFGIGFDCSVINSIDKEYAPSSYRNINISVSTGYRF